MARNILILGASYGSLLATKLLMAGHNVTLVCRRKTADLINRDGTEVRIKLRDEAVHRAIFSRDLPGKLDATRPPRSTFPATIWSALRCRSRNTPTTRSAF
jgi:nucleoside-diphosphate-sugar epimerase